MQIRFSRQFQKSYSKASPKIKSAFDQRLSMFLRNQFHSSLNNHSLKGKLAGSRSINITGDWRAIYLVEEKNSEKTVIFELLGTHSQLYR